MLLYLLSVPTSGCRFCFINRDLIIINGSAGGCRWGETLNYRLRGQSFSFTVARLTETESDGEKKRLSFFALPCMILVLNVRERKHLCFYLKPKPRPFCLTGRGLWNRGDGGNLLPSVVFCSSRVCRTSVSAAACSVVLWDIAQASCSPALRPSHVACGCSRQFLSLTSRRCCHGVHAGRRSVCSSGLNWNTLTQHCHLWL